MKTEHFIARKMAFSADASFTKVIIKIAMAAIAISITVMILTTAIISGFKKEITNKIFGFWGHIHITDSNINRNFELTPISKDGEFVEQIKEIRNIEYQSEVELLGVKWQGKVQTKTTYGGVKGVHPYIILPGVLSTKEHFHGILLKGIDKDYDWQKMKNFITDGQSIKFVNNQPSDDLLISKNIATKLGINVGDKVVISFVRDRVQIKKRFQVCGIYNTGLEEYDRRFGLADLAKLQEILTWSQNDVQGMEVDVDDVRDLDVIADYIYYEVLPQKYFAESIRSKFPSIFEWLSLQNINERIIIQLMILVGIINMITVLLILILERTQMIGTLKSLGMSNWGIRKIFIYNAGYIVFFGLIFGNILGLGIAYLQAHFQFIRLDEANYYLNTAPIDINYWTIIILNIATLVITVVFLVIPTVLVTRISPVKALKFE